ncbi:MAG: aminotransferase class V-fold PLP-dependent enzyme [Chloroflexota bacterium]
MDIHPPTTLSWGVGLDGPAAGDDLDPAVLDAADPLAPLLARFAVPDAQLVYLDGNSLGRPPIRALERIGEVARTEWAADLVRGWSRWLDLPLRVGDALAAGVLGAEPGTVAVTDSTTVNLYRLAAAALDDLPARRSVIAAADDFPTDRYIVEGLAAERGLQLRWVRDRGADGVSPDDVATLLDDDVALVLLSLVSYRTAAIADLPAVERLARAAGAHVLWDCSHAGGVVPVDLTANDVGLAVGCSYKYLNGGPGAPAWLYVAPRLQGSLRPPVRGWFAQSDQFAMGPRFEPADGIAGWLAGTPPVLSLTGVAEGVALVAEAGIDAIRAKSVLLTAYCVALVDQVLAPLGCRLGSPRDPARRGGHVAILHPEAQRLVTALVGEGVIPDFREPDIIRFGLSPLTTSFEDVHRGVRALAGLLRA